MNNLVDLKYDKFTGVKAVILKKTIKPRINDNSTTTRNITIRLASAQEKKDIPHFCLYISPKLQGGGINKVLIKLDDSEILSLGKIIHFDISSFCLISIEDFKKICDAKNVEIRIESSVGHIDFSSKELIRGAHVMYNAVVDEKAYTHEIQKLENIQNKIEIVRKAKEKKRILEEKRRKEEERLAYKEDSKRRVAEAKRKATDIDNKKNILRFWTGVLWVLLVIVLFIWVFLAFGPFNDERAGTPEYIATGIILMFFMAIVACPAIIGIGAGLWSLYERINKK